MTANIVPIRQEKPHVHYTIAVGGKSATAIEEMKAYYGMSDDELFEAIIRESHKIAMTHESEACVVLTGENIAPVPIVVDEYFRPRPREVK